MMTIFSAPDTRAIRVIWVLEEIGAKAEIRSMPYPPRRHAPDYFAVNPTGMVPLLIDGEVRLSESMAICDYLATRHGSPLIVPANDPERPPFLQWLWYGETTLMTPLSRLNILRQAERKAPEVEGAVLVVVHAAVEARGLDDPRHAARGELLEPGPRRRPPLAHRPPDAVVLHGRPTARWRASRASSKTRLTGPSAWTNSSCSPSGPLQ